MWTQSARHHSARLLAQKMTPIPNSPYPDNCTLTGNLASYGGGAYFGTLNNCTLTGNSVTGQDGWGGGACNGTLNNCTLSGNSATGQYGCGGGAYGSTMNNCIVYYNTASYGGNNNSGRLNYCCTTPMPAGGVGNLTNAPLFVATNGWSNLRLQASSPCINAGNNADAPGLIDLDGNPRITSGTVDMGAYEFSPPVILVTDGNFGFRSNRFGLNLSGTLGQTAVVEGSTTLSNQSWAPLFTNPLGSGPVYFYDPDSTNLPHRFYRLRLQ